ncbi:MAG: S8 family peptidase [Cyanobacteria bacterium P01_D01_bin.50]
MQIEWNDSSLFPETEQNITAIASVDELNYNQTQNNISLLNHSSSYSDTDDSIINTPESNLNNSQVTVVDSNIKLTSQTTSQQNYSAQNYYTWEVDNNATANQEYNSENGYGLTNAAESVAKVIGEDTFADVPDKGGKYSGADAVNAPEAWAQGYTGEGVVVAVLDTGVDYNHNDLKNNIWTNSGEIANNGIDDDGNGYIDDFYGWNFYGNNNNTMDIEGHGTHISGTIAGTNNDYGVTGIAYDAQIMPVKVLNDFGSGSSTSVTNGIYYAVDNGADVINLSLAGSFPSPNIEAAIEYAADRGVTVVMAAGNNGEEKLSYPARYADEYGIAVGAVDNNQNMAQFSNRAGSESLAYVTAPGVNIYSTLPNDKYDYYSGTSMAAPHVSGVVALMLSANPNLDSKVIRQTFEETSGNSKQTTTIKLKLVPSVETSSFESNYDAGYINQTFSTSLVDNTTTFNLDSDTNKFVNQYFESLVINYQQNNLENNKIFSSDIESMLEEPEILIQYNPKTRLIKN